MYFATDSWCWWLSYHTLSNVQPHITSIVFTIFPHQNVRWHKVNKKQKIVLIPKINVCDRDLFIGPHFSHRILFFFQKWKHFLFQFSAIKKTHHNKNQKSKNRKIISPQKSKKKSGWNSSFSSSFVSTKNNVTNISFKPNRL